MFYNVYQVPTYRLLTLAVPMQATETTQKCGPIMSARAAYDTACYLQVSYLRACLHIFHLRVLALESGIVHS